MSTEISSALQAVRNFEAYEPGLNLLTGLASVCQPNPNRIGNCYSKRYSVGTYSVSLRDRIKLSKTLYSEPQLYFSIFSPSTDREAYGLNLQSAGTPLPVASRYPWSMKYRRFLGLVCGYFYYTPEFLTKRGSHLTHKEDPS